MFQMSNCDNYSFSLNKLSTVLQIIYPLLSIRHKEVGLSNLFSKFLDTFPSLLILFSKSYILLSELKYVSMEFFDCG